MTTPLSSARHVLQPLLFCTSPRIVHHTRVIPARTAGASCLRKACFSMSAFTREESKHGRVPSFGNVPPLYKGHYFGPEAEPDVTEAEPEPSTEESTTTQSKPAKVAAGANRLIKSFLFGTEESRKEQEVLERSYSTQLMRGKYVHEIAFHQVKPECSPKYVNLISEIYPQIAADPLNKVHLVGSWRCVVGDLDTFVTIWEYNGYAGFHETYYRIHSDHKFIDYLGKVRPLLRSRHTNLMQEFSFWGGTAAPRDLGGIFELRTYDLQPGRLLEWETSWQKGIECRRQVMEPVGAWFTQLGSLNTVHHLWQFADLEHRKLSREKCWELPGWADTVHDTVKLINKMDSKILVALPFSPLKVSSFLSHICGCFLLIL
ncbi:NIPSNAP-domain-containing protein [Lipomyces doorenjongii]|uniref:NIPSNAP-domain-containing protein n=1 Tax=Lipomyces doorenjongii TaxID=383834 RepID=UPI0034CD74A7